jgi:hypothetical protein
MVMKISELLAESAPDQLPPHTIYHVSRSENRDSILSNGLIPQNVEFAHINRTPAIHGFETLDQARDWAFFFAMDVQDPVDIWQIDVGNLPIQMDPSKEMQEAYDSWIIKVPVPVSQIKLVGSEKVHTSTKYAPPTAKKLRPRLYEAKKPKPTNPKLWSQAKAQAKRKFDVWPSAYASAWAAKYYRSRGGEWRMKG